MKKENDLVARQLVHSLQEQIAEMKGMQSRLRSNYKLNGRYFQKNHVSKMDLDHVARMVFGLACEQSEKVFLETWKGVGKRMYKMYNMFDEFLLQSLK
jgi:hypothetical protein